MHTLFVIQISDQKITVSQKDEGIVVEIVHRNQPEAKQFFFTREEFSILVKIFAAARGAGL